MDSNTVGGTTSAAPNKVVPLLQQLNRLQEITSSLCMRLDPIIQHEPKLSDQAPSTDITVTQRLTSIGDALQYLLDHIEL